MNFDLVASAVKRIFSTPYRVSPLFLYLVVFLTLGPPLSPVCHSNVHIAFAVLPVLAWSSASPRAMRGACRVFRLSRLRAQLSTPTARLSDAKFARIVALLRLWFTNRTRHRQDSDSLPGHLHHASNVVRPGRTFPPYD